MKKEEFIAKYGEEAYNQNRQRTKEWKKANKEKYYQRNKEWLEANKERIKEKSDEWCKRNREKINERSRRRRASYSEEDRKKVREHYNAYAKERMQNDPVFRYKQLFNSRKIAGQVVSVDEAMTLLVKEAEECGCPELLNMDCMVERFHSNCMYGLDYGNLEILKYFYRLMQIKAAKNESFNESDKEMLRYFRSWKVDTHKNVRLYFDNGWALDAANVDMVYVEDMARNAKGLDLLVTEEKYNELKGLKTE